jgi:hypothetical protein
LAGSGATKIQSFLETPNFFEKNLQKMYVFQWKILLCQHTQLKAVHSLSRAMHRNSRRGQSAENENANRPQREE